MRTCHYLKWIDIVNVLHCLNKSVVFWSDWLYVQQFLFITRFQLGDNATTIFQQSQWHSSKAIIITHNTIISLLTSSCLRIIGHCGSMSLGFGSVLCYMKNTILYEDSYLNMSTAAKSTMSKNVDESSFFKTIEWASKINFTYAVEKKSFFQGII